MANPALGAAGLGASIFGSLLGTAGAQQSGQAQAGMYGYQAGVAELNSQIAQQNANYASQEGELQAAKYGIGARQQAGHIVAAQASSGLDVGSGSAKQVQESQHTVSTLDQNTIRMNAAKTAYNYETQAVQYGAQAKMDLLAKQNVEAATPLNVASSLVSGAGSVASKWLQGSQMGLWSGAGNAISSAFGS